MERALTLIASGTLTIKIARDSTQRGRTILPSHFNNHTGKMSKLKTGFNDSTWGDTTCDFAELASCLSKVKYDAIVQEAQPYVNVKQNRARKQRTEAVGVVENKNKRERACLPSASDNDDDC